MRVKKIAPIQPTKDQREWLEWESVKTGESHASIIRKLIQEKINNEHN